jgi:hypothetical protein
MFMANYRFKLDSIFVSFLITSLLFMAYNAIVETNKEKVEKKRKNNEAVLENFGNITWYFDSLMHNEVKFLGENDFQKFRLTGKMNVKKTKDLFLLNIHTTDALVNKFDDIKVIILKENNEI